MVKLWAHFKTIMFSYIHKQQTFRFQNHSKNFFVDRVMNVYKKLSRYIKQRNIKIVITK